MKLFIPGAGGKVQHILNFQSVQEVSEVVISDINDWSPGNFSADKGYLLPPFQEPDFMSKFIDLDNDEKFDLCIPLHDASLSLFSKFRNIIRCPLLINNSESIDIISDKMKTFAFFKELGLNTPETILVEDFDVKFALSKQFYIKPKKIHLRGTEKQFFHAINDEIDAQYAKSKTVNDSTEYVVQDLIEGEEINIDFFCDLDQSSTCS